MARVRLGIYLGDDGCKLGPGKVRLLEAVRDTGSISGAARSMGMGYRHAWVLVDELNRCFDQPVVVASAGGSDGGGAALTPWGERLVASFQEMERTAIGSIERQLRTLDRRLAMRRAGPAKRARVRPRAAGGRRRARPA